jgi:hypothetical protein
LGFRNLIFLQEEARAEEEEHEEVPVDIHGGADKEAVEQEQPSDKP